MSQPIEFPMHKTRPPAFRPKLVTDELADISTPERLLSNALEQIRSAATLAATVKSGEAGEIDCIREVLIAFRGPDFGGEDDGA